MCRPQPNHVGLPQFLHSLLEHMVNQSIYGFCILHSSLGVLRTQFTGAASVVRLLLDWLRCDPFFTNRYRYDTGTECNPLFIHSLA